MVESVKVTANVALGEERLEQRIQEEIKYVLVTNNVKRDWKCLKSRVFFVDALYLQKTSRIYDLLWIMSIALRLVYTAMEYKISQPMKEHSQAIPSIVKGRIEELQILMRMLQYIVKHRISLVKLPNDTLYICNMSPQLKEILIELEPDIVPII